MRNHLHPITDEYDQILNRQDLHGHLCVGAVEGWSAAEALIGRTQMELTLKWRHFQWPSQTKLQVRPQTIFFKFNLRITSQDLEANHQISMVWIRKHSNQTVNQLDWNQVEVLIHLAVHRSLARVTLSSHKVSKMIQKIEILIPAQSMNHVLAKLILMLFGSR